jgi:hypothetical protein
MPLTHLLPPIPGPFRGHSRVPTCASTHRLFAKALGVNHPPVPCLNMLELSQTLKFSYNTGHVGEVYLGSDLKIYELPIATRYVGKPNLRGNCQGS